MRYFDYLPSNVPVKGEFSSDNINVERPRRALVAEAKGDPNLPSLLIFAHPDSELVREIEQWRSDPFVPAEIEGSIVFTTIIQGDCKAMCRLITVQW